MNYEEQISKSLGSANSYAVSTDKFDTSLLNPIPRDSARKDWGISGNEFVGVDVWHCHEATFLTNNGIPVAGTLKICYPSNTIDMVESKSFKLYLNSFDMCKMGSTIKEAIKNYESQIKYDLSNLLSTNVEVTFHKSGSDNHSLSVFTNYQDLHSLVEKGQDLITITDYEAKEDHLQFTETGDDYEREYSVFTNVLRSRCRHTKQKDTGTAFIYIKTRGSRLNLISLFREIVSLREVNEFHEFCAEKLYTSIMKHTVVEECMVGLLYSRRGSLDINPVRASKESLLPYTLFNTKVFTKKTQGQ